MPPIRRRHATNLMLNLCEGHVFVELNYPHIIGFSGYERHHDVARMTVISHPRDVHQSCQIETTKLQGKQWRSKGRAPIRVLKTRAVKTRVLKASRPRRPMRRKRVL